MAESSGLSFKTFVSENELEEKRKKRQEEWEKVRTSEQPLEAPEEEYDPRSLFDRLQEQKDKKQAEYDEAHQFKNMVKGLDDGEAEFLDEVSNRQIEIENKRWEEEIKEIKEFRKARAELEGKVEDKQKPAETGKPTVKTTATSSRKSQQSLLAGAVKRKRSSSEDKREEKSLNADSKTSDASTETSNSESKNGGETMAKYVAVLPGLGVYSNSSESDSSSDSEIEVPTSRCKAQCIKKKK